MSRVRVTSAEFQKGFGRYREAAMREPIMITNHGRESLVLLSAEEYQRLASQDRQSLYAWELSDEDIKALEMAEPPSEAEEFDFEMRD